MQERIIAFFTTYNLVIAGILGILSVIVIPIFVRISRRIKEKHELAFPKEQSIYLSKPEKKEHCLGRDKLLRKIYAKIKGEEPSPFLGNHMYITGMEGIGKTLFYQTLCLSNFQYAGLYIGWITCNGGQSLFGIINKTFNDPLFHKKNKEELLNSFEKLIKTCVLFINQIDQYTNIEEIRELAASPNITIVASGLLKKISFFNDSMNVRMEPLSDRIIRKIFEDKSGEEIDAVAFKERNDVKLLLSEYVKGNPFLASAFAVAKKQNNDNWSDMLSNILTSEYDIESDDYIKRILRKLYKINQLNARKSIFIKPAFFYHKFSN